MKPFSRDFIIISKLFLALLVLLWAAAFWYLRNPVLFGHGKTVGPALHIDPTLLEQKVRFLTSLSPARQYKNEQSMLAAESFAKAEFEKLGYLVSLQEVFAFQHTYHNVIARVGDPNAKEVVVIGAHYDVCDDQPGADDNASGVAGVLELARLFKTQAPKLAIPVEFVIYSLEEPPFFGGNEMGSAIHADQLHKNGIAVRYMVSLEMIGYFSHQIFSQQFNLPFLYLIYPWVGDFIGVVGSPQDRDLVKHFKLAMTANSSLPVVSINAPRFVPGIDYSDHRSYWNQGWPAIMITDTAFLRNTEYHKKGDTPERLDYAAMAEVVRGVYAAVVLLDDQPL